MHRVPADGANCRSADVDYQRTVVLSQKAFQLETCADGTRIAKPEPVRIPTRWAIYGFLLQKFEISCFHWPQSEFGFQLPLHLLI